MADIELGGYTLSTPSPLDRSSRVVSQKSRIILDRSHEDTGKANIRLKKSRKLVTMTFTPPTTPRLRSTYYITTPDGDVKEYTFSKEFVDSSDLLIPGKSIKVTFPFTLDGSYQIELVREDGIAYVNTSLTRGTVWSLLSPFSDEVLRTIRKSTTIVIQDTLKKINTLRMTL